MAYKRQYWKPYHKSDIVIEIKITDGADNRLDEFKTNNENQYKKILKWIRNKYGFSYP